MNKRSAMMVAAGLILALLVAGMAVATGFTGPEAAASGSGASQLERREPKVRTTTETVTIHRDAKTSGQATAPSPVVITQSPAVAPTDDDAFDDDEYDDDDEYEHEDEDDHEDDSYEHEDDDHEGEDD